MKARIKFTNAKFKNQEAVVEIEDNQLIFYIKRKWVKIFFGLIGDTIESSNESFRVNLNDVKKAYRVAQGWGKELTLSIGEEEIKMFFSRDTMPFCLEIENLLWEKLED